MQLFYWQSEAGNFGDDLNAWLWPRLWPGFAESNLAEWLVGIGTILDKRLLSLPGSKLIMGTGHRPNWVRPVPPQDDWNYGFVRGPHTANALGVDPALAICDPAIMVADLIQRPAPSNRVGFMPHIVSARNIDCRRAAEAAGLVYIDPHADVDATLAALASLDRVIVEAMHGAIVADAFGVPWIRVRCLSWRVESVEVASFKWADWASTLELDPSPRLEIHLPFRHRGRFDHYINALTRGRRFRTLARSLATARDMSGYQCSKAPTRHALRDRILTRIAELRESDLRAA